MLSVALFFGYLAEAELQLGKVLFFKKVFLKKFVLVYFQLLLFS
jgi:hypothetical protein